MSDTNACCGGAENTLIFACSGASNVGQLTNDVALRLAENRLGSMSCIAAIGAHLDGFVVSAQDCDRLVVVDGCERTCALLTFRQVKVEPHIHITLTDHVFEKKHGEKPNGPDRKNAYDHVVSKMQESPCSISS